MIVAFSNSESNDVINCNPCLKLFARICSLDNTVAPIQYQDSGHKAHLERKQCKSRADKLLELKIAGLMEFTFDHAR